MSEYDNPNVFFILLLLYDWKSRTILIVNLIDFDSI